MYFFQTQSLSRCNAGERYLRVTFGTPKKTKKQSQRGLAVVLLLTFANTDSTATATVPKPPTLSLSLLQSNYTPPASTITPLGASGPPTKHNQRPTK